jgi:hypothetical protein
MQLSTTIPLAMARAERVKML